jgi:transposase
MLFAQDFLQGYNHVRIKDSTTFKIPSNLAANYKGYAGNAAGVTIQYEFDLKTGQFLDLTVTEAARNDQRDANETANNVFENDLIIRDLGYFSTSVLQKIDKEKAFFLSKLQAATGVYDENGVEIDFKKLHVFMTTKGIEKCEKQVFIGKCKLPVRLVIGLVPPQVYEQRIRRKQKEERERGSQMKDRTKFLCHFNLFITNVDAQKLPIEKVMPLYRFRWQVELMFKNWKSIFRIHDLQKMKEERYITMLYIRLILIVINLQITNQVQCALSKQGGKDTVLSYRKTLQTLKNSFSEILGILRCTQKEAIKLLEKICYILSKNHWREKRKNRENFVDDISLFICISQ